MRLNWITFLFANQDHLSIEGIHIGDFLIDEVKQIVNRTAMDSIDVVNIAHQFALEISKDANVDFYEFEDTETEAIKVFDRLKENDITEIIFELEDEEDVMQLSFMMSWSEDDDYTNLYQETLISKFGHLYISVNDTNDKSVRFQQKDIDSKGKNQELLEYIRAYKKSSKSKKK